MGTTAENLKAAAADEHLEWGTLYPDLVQVADKEGFSEIAKVFRMIVIAETGHEERYLALLENIEKGRVFKRAGFVKWRCRNRAGISTRARRRQKYVRPAPIRRLTTSYSPKTIRAPGTDVKDHAQIADRSFSSTSRAWPVLSSRRVLTGYFIAEITEQGAALVSHDFERRRVEADTVGISIGLRPNN